MAAGRVVSREEWLEARKAFLAKEKALTRQRDALARERRELPWVWIDKAYVFDAPEGRVTLALNYNFGTSSFGGEEAPGLSAFRRGDDDAVYHTYSTYARGLDMANGAYHMLDLTSKGRDEDGLPWPMAWVKRHDSY